MEHAADRLLAAVDRVGSPVCVGLDPVAERLPETLRPRRPGTADLVAAFADFGTGVLDAVAGQVPCRGVLVAGDATGCFPGAVGSRLAITKGFIQG